MAEPYLAQMATMTDDKTNELIFPEEVSSDGHQSSEKTKDLDELEDNKKTTLEGYPSNISGCCGGTMEKDRLDDNEKEMTLERCTSILFGCCGRTMEKDKLDEYLQEYILQYSKTLFKEMTELKNRDKILETKIQSMKEEMKSIKV